MATAPRVRTELAACGRLDTTLGQLALALAQQIDVGDLEGSALASVSRELRLVMAELAPARAPSANGLDQISRRRASKGLGA
jgi:hypothetical protein